MENTNISHLIVLAILISRLMVLAVLKQALKVSNTNKLEDDRVVQMRWNRTGILADMNFKFKDILYLVVKRKMCFIST
jgi:hypothetical protein